MAARKTGQEMPCMICGTVFYRRGSYIKRGIRKTCGNRECKSKSMSGENNPFWGQDHSQEVKDRIRRSNRSRPQKGGFRKGHKPSAETRALKSAEMLARWRTNRDLMLSYQTRQPERPREELRYRRNFTQVQKELWPEKECRWCKATENLVLDHIVPVMCGGKNERTNAQTLCRPCNIWKMVYVDRPLFLAGLGSQEGLKS
jgi:5-methylcytosine-specific restriction endonuclease McrA